MRSIRWITLALATPVVASAQPGVAEFKQVLTAQLEALKSQGFTERTVLFQDVRALPANGGYFPFEVSATVHDYAPGYPPNGYYGQTCVGQMDRWKFDMLRNTAGRWIVQGRMTVSDARCVNNTAAGVSAIPVASLKGAPASNGSPAEPSRAAGAAGTNTPQLYLGEYACYGTGGRMMTGMGFLLKSGGTYTDTDGARGGRYRYAPDAATITFTGGFLDGQTGRNVVTTGFQLTATVNCEPWR